MIMRACTPLSFNSSLHRPKVFDLKSGHRWRRRERHGTPEQPGEAFSQSILNAVAAEIVMLDRDGVILAVNEPWLRFARENGVESGQPASNTGVGTSYFAVCGGESEIADADGLQACDGNQASAGIRAVLAGSQASFSFEYPCDSPSQKRWFRMSCLPLGRKAKDGVVITHTDISELKLAETGLRIAATAFESQQGMTITDAAQVILQVNKAFTEITGYTAQEAVGQNPRLLSSGRHDALFYEKMWTCIALTGSWQGELWNRRKNGEVFPEWITINAVRDDAGVATHYVATFNDITSRKTAEDQIQSLAFYDPLTRLPNRRLLLDRLHQAMTASGRNNSHGALLLLDLDNFKALNDTLGHEVGDKLLQQVAKRLNTCIREGDTVARLGGDEFMLILTSLSACEAMAATETEKVTEDILATLSRSYRIGQADHHSSASIGVTLFMGSKISIDDLMKQSDLTMYKAKDAGRNSVRFFDPAMEVSVKARAVLEEDLRRALSEAQFELYYQAQVTSESRLTGAEVLLRWHHPRRGLVPPAEFIPLAEDTGLIVSIGRWVLETACAQLAKWAERPEMAHLTVAVNVSAKQFKQSAFVEQVLLILKETGANPMLLKLELTESLLIDDVAQTIEKMFALKAIGVGFSLDDFGTGYSSLSYLKRMPLDQLKIDQSFVRDILVDPNDAAIASTVVALARSLGLGVIAEGVETQAQRDFLASAGCHDYQGYFFSRPLPIDGFEGLSQHMDAGRITALGAGQPIDQGALV